MIVAVAMWPAAQVILSNVVLRRLGLRVRRFDTATMWSAS